jgi:hypothetical protein
MALWGNKDDKTSTGTVAVAANGEVTGTSTVFTTEAKVGDFLAINSTVSFIINSITSDTVANVIAAKKGTVVNAIASAVNYTLNEKPISVALSEVPSATSGDHTQVFGVDTTEMGVTDATHAGWVRRVTKTDMHATDRVMHEVLVAGSSISGDAADDTEFADS